jgi:hypothetical protein
MFKQVPISLLICELREKYLNAMLALLNIFFSEKILSVKQITGCAKVSVSLHIKNLRHISKIDYREHLKTRLVQSSDHEKVSQCQMVQKQNGHKNH